MSTFSELGLSQPTMQAIEALGFTSPTLIQQKVIPVLIKNDKDLIALAQTGTGKTAAFGLPLIELVNSEERHTQALVLSPTRELCMQITSDLKDFSKFKPQLKITAVYGGAGIREQMESIKRGTQIIVATPGRLIDLIARGSVKLQNIKYLVLDEADEMLNMGFQEDIDEILKSTPAEKLTWLFSATMPDEIRRISKKYMTQPAEITAGEANRANENIDHQYFVVQQRDKYAALKRILDFTPEIFGIIFCRTRIETQQISEDLMKDGYDANALHGDLNQAQRDKVMRSFKNRSLQILVATDVAARGIDVDDVTHIIHLHLPDDMDFYTHRSGRTARAGKSGISMVLVSDRDVYKIKQLEKKLRTPFHRKKIPTGIEVCEKQLLSMIHKVREVEVNEQDIAPFLHLIEEEFSEMSKQEIIKRFASLEFNRFLDYYRQARDLNTEGKERRERSEDRASGGTELFINLGKMDEVHVGTLLSLIDQYCGVKGKEIGNIKLKGAYSFFEVPPQHVKKVIDGFNGKEFHGRRIRVEEQDQSGAAVEERRDQSGGDSPREESYSDRKKSRGSDSGERSGGFRERKKFGGDAGGERSGGFRERKKFGGDASGERSGGFRERKKFGSDAGGERSGGFKERKKYGGDAGNEKSAGFGEGKKFSHRSEGEKTRSFAERKKFTPDSSAESQGGFSPRKRSAPKEQSENSDGSFEKKKGAPYVGPGKRKRVVKKK
ncbi:MAG: DEAD/DEAH box helicase [Chitinophagales bacterium]|nr:DEAD/DEAH box helicase [Chitinophagales bacterium]